MSRGSTRPVGVLGSEPCVDGVAEWSLTQKLTVALRRTVPLLPVGMREEFGALLSPENIGITVGTLVVWVGSHAVGVGEIVDIILLVAGAAMLGMAAIDVARDLKKFATFAGSARCHHDLDTAAAHLAKAVSVIGVVAFAALLTKGAGKLKAGGIKAGLPPVEAQSAQPQRFYQILTPLDAEMSGEGALARELRRAALDDYYQMHPKLNYKGMVFDEGQKKWIRSRPKQRRGSHIAGTNLTKSVVRRILQPGEIIEMHQRVGGQSGTYLARPGSIPDQLGISGAGRVLRRFQVIEPLEIMESTANAIGPGHAPGVRGAGGARQLIMPPDWERRVRKL